VQNLTGAALFFDLDGTLLDLAATPDQVTVEPGLAEMLARFEHCVSGALALVTGRQAAFVDTLFPGHRFTVAGLHGAEIRPGEAAGRRFLSPPRRKAIPKRSGPPIVSC